MNCNDPRTIANRENAKKSTGPRTAEGKARSRANAFKHGLAGEGVAFPGEVAGEMQQFVDKQVASEPIPPRDDREQMLVEKIARIAWQLDRAERAEEAQSIIRAADAVQVVRKARFQVVAGLVGLMEAEPGWAMSELLESKDGCRWAIDSLREMIDAVDADWWLASLDERLDALCAPAQPGRLRITRAKALALALGSANYEAIWPNGAPGLEPPEDNLDTEAYCAWVRRRDAIARQTRPKWRADLRAILERRLAEIQRRLDELSARPDPGLELADLAATFDLGEKPERLRRYIRSRERERRHLLAELERHRTRRDEHPNEGEPEAESVTGAVAEPHPPLTPFEDPSDSALDVEGHGLNTPQVTEKWVRSGIQEFDAFGRRNLGPAPDEKASR